MRRRPPSLPPPPRDDDEAALLAETVERLAGALEGVDDVERGDRLALGVLGVGDRVSDDVLEAGGQWGSWIEWR